MQKKYAFASLVFGAITKPHTPAWCSKTTKHIFQCIQFVDPFIDCSMIDRHWTKDKIIISLKCEVHSEATHCPSSIELTVNKNCEWIFQICANIATGFCGIFFCLVDFFVPSGQYAIGWCSVPTAFWPAATNMLCVQEKVFHLFSSTFTVSTRGLQLRSCCLRCTSAVFCLFF